MRGFLEGDAPGELGKLVTRDNQPARLAIDMAEARLGRYDPVQPAGFYRRVDETSFTNW